jgi:amino acid adenylation domain-containing protein
LSGALEYNTDLFERSTIKRMLEHFETLLESISHNPDLPISRLSILTNAERAKVLEQCNHKPRVFPQDLCLHQLFEQQAANTPQAVALSHEGQAITYQELNRRANRLASYLQKLGVGPETRVAIGLERSLEMVLGILAILKAGGAYVPLDLALPKERLSFMLSDAETHLLLTQEQALSELPEFAGAIVSLDRDRDCIERESEKNPSSNVTSENPAYVIYTSGSTGKPKGVLVTHANVVRLFAATDQWFDFGTADVWTLFHSYAFDFSVWELWGALIHGGRLVIVPYWISRDPEAFYDLLCRERVTVLNQTPSAFRQLIGAEQSAEGQPDMALRLIIFGGEAVDLQSLDPWFARRGDEWPRLINMYGITETTVHVTYRRLRGADLHEERGSVVGWPIPDLQVYVLDQELQPAPFGIPGELYVGGDGLARGYLNRPGLTAERFIPNPFDASAGSRLYRTGDKARRLPDGDLEYLGRVDQQVKIRGHRIELGEIEAALNGHEHVQEAVVVLRKEPAADQRLIAYVSLRQDLTIEELREYVQTRLPDYMVPSAFVKLDHLPLTNNGKVDRRALPDPDPNRPALESAYVAPRTPVEEILAAVWANVLAVEKVGIHDNFFALGGDSIRSVNIIALARDRGLEISIQQLFRHQTIAALAKVVSRKTPDAPTPAATGPFDLISDKDREKLPDTLEDAYPLTMLQMGMFYHMELMPGFPLYHNVNSWPLKITFNLGAFQAAVAEVVARHSIFRTSFDLINYSEPLQLVHRTAVLPVGVIDLRGATAAEQAQIVVDFVSSESDRRFDLSCPPLLRFHFHLLTDTTLQFSLTECHAILDGWSLTSTLAEIFAHYFALINDQEPPLPGPAAFLFRDFVRLERLALDSDECREYWREKLHGCRIVNLPRWTDTDQAPGRERIRTVHVPISDAVNDGIKRAARLAKVPIKSVLLTAHMKVLSLLSGQRDVMGGLLCNGRPEDMDGTEVRGLFLNAVPFRLELRDGSWLELVQQTFESEWELLPYRRYPLSAMQRQTGGQPLFETQFNFVHFHALSGVLGSGEVQVAVAGIRRSEETQFALATAFSRDIMSATLDLVLEFDMTKVCEEQTVAIASYYERALEAIAADPLANHDQQSLLPVVEAHRLLFEWNENKSPEARTACLHELFEAQVEKTPEAIAIVSEDLELTYRQLNERSNQLAHYLRLLGVSPEVRVGVFMDRSVEMVVGLLGILKAGGAYVPLDTGYPKERLVFMLADSQVTLVLTQEQLVEKLPPTAAGLVSLETVAEAVLAQDKTNPCSEAVSGNLVYVLYTSGSTGKPKGAMLTHAGIVNCIDWMQKNYQLTGNDRFLFKTSLNFDPSVWELFWPLTVGAGVVVPHSEEDHLGAYVIDCIIRYGVTAIYFVPSMLKLVLDSGRLGEAVTLRFVICGGESISVETVARFFDVSLAELHHSYGPTETSIAVSEWTCDRAQKIGMIPIGRPLANTQVYVLDRHLQPVPIGVPGQLYVGGIGLGRGYLQRPDLTAERFIPNPFSKEPSARMYDTGDQVRYRPDGSLVFLGRLDDQVKVRGFRIELGEIVTALEQHRAVREAIVLASQDALGMQRLTAYMIADAAHRPASGEMRGFLEMTLPKHSVPSGFIFLESWPLMSNGKIDRRALLNLESLGAQPATDFVLPRTELEQIVATIWKEVLAVETVGVNDNFFDLGGHSLSMLQVHNKLREAFQQPVSMIDMFQYPTISSMSEKLSSRQDGETSVVQGQQRAENRRESAARQRMRRAARSL